MKYQPTIGSANESDSVRMELCCFCREVLTSVNRKKKMKLLHKVCCADARSRLAALLHQRRGRGLNGYEETKDTAVNQPATTFAGIGSIGEAYASELHS